jgi:hypothetical protein
MRGKHPGLGAVLPIVVLALACSSESSPSGGSGGAATGGAGSGGTPSGGSSGIGASGGTGGTATGGGGASGSGGAAGSGGTGPGCGTCASGETCITGDDLDVCGVAYFVAETGDDQNPGTEALPMRTILAAYAKAQPGQYVIVEPGTYSETYNDYGIRLNDSGTASAPITVQSQYRWKAVLDGQNDSSHGEVVYFTGSYNVVANFEIENGFLGGVVMYGDDNTLRGCHIHDNGSEGDPSSSYGQDGVYSDSATQGNRYIGNYIHDNGRIAYDSNLDHGLYLCGDGEVVMNNVVTGNSAYGLQIAGYTTVSGMKVYNNVFASNGRSGIVIWQDMDGVEIENNLFYQNKIGGISSYGAHGSGVVFDHNAFSGNPSFTIDFTGGSSDYTYTESATASYDPLFAAPTSGDFHLQASSPAIDTGMTIAEVTTDFDGTPRPQGAGYDLGAYER